MDSSTLATAAKAAQALLDPDGSQEIAGYWTDGTRFAFAVEPDPLDDTMLVYEDGVADWRLVGPLSGDTSAFGFVDEDPTPYADAERLGLIVDALASDEDTPADVLAQAKADLAAAQ